MVHIFNPGMHSQQAAPFQQLQQQPGYYNDPNQQQDNGQPKSAMDYILSKFGAGGAAGIESGITSGIQQQLKRSALDKMLNNLNPNMSPRERIGVMAQADAETQPLLQELWKQEDAQRVQQQQQQAQDALFNSYKQPQTTSQAQAPQGAEQATGQVQSPVDPVKSLSQEEAAIFENYRNLSPAERKVANKKLEQIQKDKKEEIKLANSETAGFRDYISKERKAYEKNDFLIKNMERLVDTKKLDNPTYYSMLRKINMDIPALLNTESQEYIKYQQEYLTGVKEALGSQISAWEVEQYMKKIPTLENTDQGKRAIFRNQKIENEARGALVKAYDEILAENGGNRPRDIESQAKARADAIKKELADEFRQNAGLPQSEKIPEGLPPAQQSAGKKIKDNETGIVYLSNGSTWVRAQ